MHGITFVELYSTVSYFIKVSLAVAKKKYLSSLSSIVEVTPTVKLTTWRRIHLLLLTREVNTMLIIIINNTHRVSVVFLNRLWYFLL